MQALKTKALRSLEKKMEEIEAGSFRFHVLESAKNFKTSWIELGRALSSVWRDKLFRDWGYSNLELYARKEVGIKKDTAMKLLRSYYFLEKEEPSYLKQEYMDSLNLSSVPSYESVDVLRKAKNKKSINEEDYANLKKTVFEKGKDARDVKKDLTAMIRQREELDPDEAREKRKDITLKRFVSTLKSLKQEIEISKFASASLIKDMTGLLKKLESEL